MNNSKLEIKIIDDINQGKIIWNKLSPQKSLYDEWSFRFCFYRQKNFPIRFLVGKYKNEIIGLLPLQLNTEKGYLEFFGGEYMDNNKVFICSGFENYTQQFYQAVTEKAFLNNLYGDCDFIKKQAVDHYLYILTLNNIKNHEDYIEKYFKGSSEHRRELRRGLKKVSENNIKTIKNNFNDIEFLFKYKIKRFGINSCFNDQSEKQNFINLLKLKYDFYLFTYIVNKIKVGISLSVLYQQKYMFLETASDIKLYPNIGKYITMNNIDRAIQLDAKIFDLSHGGESWKEKWNFEKIPQYSFKNYKE